MKKILYMIPVFMFIVIFVWGFVNINIENTTVFNNKDQVVTSVDNEKLKDNIGMDLSMFSKDNSSIKIYRQDNKSILVYKNYAIDLDKSFLGKGLIYVVDYLNLGAEKLSMFIDTIIQ